MKRQSRLLASTITGVAAVLVASGFARGQAGDAVTPVSHRDVTITDSFWLPRIENNRNNTIRSLFNPPPGSDLDLRVLEAACYSLAHHPDPQLSALVDGQLDAAIANVRREKGRWPQTFDGSLPTPGYFFETAAAHHELTGSRKLLDVAIEIANDIDATFGPGKRYDISNHEGIKNGLVRLYGITGDAKYLKLAQFFLDRRGNHEHREVMYGPYAQDHKPIVEQERAIGHSVRATYLYMSLADIAALSGSDALHRANSRIWQDVVSKRTFLTGGVGAYRDEEDFSEDYYLPNLNTWNENCAAFGAVMWNQRLFASYDDATYIDVLERTLYNGFLVGVSLDAKKYLYQAPLRTYGDFDRHESFGPNCCPPNIARLFPQLGGFIYATKADDIYVNLFVASKATAKPAGGPVEIEQQTVYPRDGAIRLTLRPQTPRRFAVKIRIPGWAREEVMPGGLYHYLDTQTTPIKLTVNGGDVPVAVEKGYATIEREWKSGDTIGLLLPMPVRRVVAHDRVAECNGMVALERGPLVYCLEKVDNPGGVFNLVLPDAAELRTAFRDDLLGGVNTILGMGQSLSRGGSAGSPLISKPVDFTAVPYYAFANRGPGEMTVWLPRDARRVWLPPRPSIASSSRATSSVGNGTVAENYPDHAPPTVAKRFFPISQDGSGSLSAIYDQLEPTSSEDGSAPFFRMRPQSGDQAWVQYDFAQPTRVSSVEVYWKDDKQYVIPPKSWRLLGKVDNEWKPVATKDEFGVALDRFNRVTFDPVSCTGLRMEITLAPKVFPKNTLGPPDGNYLEQDVTWYEAGIIEWRVNP